MKRLREGKMAREKRKWWRRREMKRMEKMAMERGGTAVDALLALRGQVRGSFVVADTPEEAEGLARCWQGEDSSEVAVKGVPRFFRRLVRRGGGHDRKTM